MRLASMMEEERAEEMKRITKENAVEPGNGEDYGNTESMDM
jgi:hypothetical protein